MPLQKFRVGHILLKIRKLLGIAVLNYFLKREQTQCYRLFRVLEANQTLDAKFLRDERDLAIKYMKKLAHRFAGEAGLFIG